MLNLVDIAVRENKNVYIYGSGKTGVDFFQKSVRYQIKDRFKGFIDSTSELHGNYCCGYQIYHPAELQKSNDAIVIIASTTPQFITEISATIMSAGVASSNIYLHTDFLEKKIYTPIENIKLDSIRKNLLSGKEVYQMVIESRRSKNWDRIKDRFYTNEALTQQMYTKNLKFDDYKIIFDLGTFNGYEAKKFAMLSPNAKVYSFDVLGDKNVEPKFMDDRVFYVEAAISDVSKSVYFTEMPNFLGGASYISEKSQKENSRVVETITLDEFCIQNNIAQVDYIKTDLEGSDLAALRGAERIIKDCLPDIAVSIYHSNADMYSIAEYLLQIVPEYNTWFDHYGEDLDGSILYCSRKRLI